MSLFSLSIIFVLLILTTVYFISLVSADLIAKEKERLINLENDLSEISIREGEIRAFNSIISEIDSFYGESTDLTMIMKDLREVLPPGSHIDSFQYDRSRSVTGKINRIGITGYAPDWQALLQIERGLEERFDNVEFSPGVWAQISDIVFSINLETR